MKENPGPNAYGTFEKSPFDRQKGKTFGASRECYEKVYIPKEKIPSKQKLKKI